MLPAYTAAYTRVCFCYSLQSDFYLYGCKILAYQVGQKEFKDRTLACTFQVYFVEKRRPVESPHPAAATPTVYLLFLSFSLSVVSTRVPVWHF